MVMNNASVSERAFCHLFGEKMARCAPDEGDIRSLVREYALAAGSTALSLSISL